MPFEVGNNYGKGRPKKPIELKYLKLLQQACTFDQWKNICTRAVADAADGDRHARAWLSKYLLPEPVVNEDQPEKIVLRWIGNE